MTIDSMFSTFDTSKNKFTRKSKKGKNGKPIFERPPKMSLSAQEIRDKVAKGLGKTSKDKVKLSNSGKKFGDSFMDNNPENEAPPVGDISMNDPNDVVTQEKLRGLVQKGGFNFSDKEKQVLAGILGNQ